MEQGIISISSGGALCYQGHDSHKDSRTNSAGYGSEGNQESACICNKGNVHVEGTPGDKRHHQASNGNTADYIIDSGYIYGRMEGDKKHPQVADYQKCRTCHNRAFIPSLSNIFPAKGLTMAIAREPGRVTSPETVAERPITD